MADLARTVVMALVAVVAVACVNGAPPAAVGGVPSDARDAFACGPSLSCNPDRQYCSVMTGGPVGVPPSYNCIDLPAACLPNPSCRCVADQIGCTCSEAAGRLTVTCTAP